MKQLKLANSFLALKNISERRPEGVDFQLPKIIKISKNLDFSKLTKPIQVRPDVLPKWLSAVNTGDYSNIKRSDLKHLYWTEEVSLSKEFFEYLFNVRPNIRRSSVKGFVLALANKWNEVLSGKFNIEQCHHIITQLSSTDYLKSVEPYIFNKSGNIQFSNRFIEKKGSLSVLFSDVFGLVLPASQYKDSVLKNISTNHFPIALSDSRGNRHWYYQEILKSLSKSDLMTALGKIVMQIENAKAEEAKEELKEFILKHPNLGDPRLPGLEANWNIDSGVRNLIIEWLSQSDINFFFELFFQDRKDTQGRKKFWLKYAHHIKGSRVVVSQSDASRLTNHLAKMDKLKINPSIFGHFSDRSDTAFIMDFGVLKVVEFSVPNNACYFYDNKSKFKFNDRSVFWETKDFKQRDLKNTVICTENYPHNPPDAWTNKFARLLSDYGIREKSPKGRYA